MADFNSLSTQEHLWLLYAALGVDCRLHVRDVQTLRRRLQNEGVSFLTKTLPRLGKALYQGLSSGVFSLPTCFQKSHKGSSLPAFLGSLFRKIFRDDGSILAEPDVLAIKRINQICMLVYKAEDIQPSAELDQAVCDRFCQTEEELKTISYRDSDPILRFANLIALHEFSDFDPDGITPKHGPGVTANVGLTDKFSHRLTPGLPVLKQFGRMFFFNEHSWMEQIDRFPVWSHNDFWQSRNVAKVILVPKDSRGPRLISCEPAENQYIQQGILGYLYNKIHSAKSLFCGQVNIEDQEINRSLVREHSKDRAFSTLDLKDASDRVSLALVRRIFDKTPLLPSLLSARSESTLLPDGRQVALSKHAPMGSATCFPIMAISIYLLLVASLVGVGCSLEDALKSVYVYGDDIVIRTEHAAFGCDVLERYGLRVNRDKSFINSYFLESCGCDCFKGSEVQPIRLSRCNITRGVDMVSHNPNLLVSSIKTANLLSSQYPLAAEYLYKYSEHWLGPLPYGSERSPYLCRTCESDSIPEMNYLSGTQVWRRRKNLQRFPLGAVMQVWMVDTTVLVNPSENIFGHLTRIWGQLGDNCFKQSESLPGLGEYTPPRQFTLRRKFIDALYAY